MTSTLEAQNRLCGGKAAQSLMSTSQKASNPQTGATISKVRAFERYFAPPKLEFKQKKTCTNGVEKDFKNSFFQNIFHFFSTIRDPKNTFERISVVASIVVILTQVLTRALILLVRSNE